MATIENDNTKKLANVLANLGDEIHLLTSLLEGGHLKPEEAYYKVKELWRQAKHTKRDLFPDMTYDEGDPADEVDPAEDNLD